MAQKYRVQFAVSIELATEISADSLEAALKVAHEMARRGPVDAGLVRLQKKTEYLWDNENTVSGVSVA